MYDYYNPFMAARVVTQSGEIIPLWVNAPLGEGAIQDELKASGIHSLSYVSEIRVEVMLGYISTITVTLTPPMREAQAILNASPSIVEFGQSVIQVQFGYLGEGGSATLSPVFEGLMLKPDISMGTDITITLRGQGTSAVSASRQEGNLTGKNTRREWIKTLAMGRNLNQARNVKIDFSDADADSETRLLLDTEVEISQSYQSDYWMVWQLVKASKCWMVERGGTWDIISRKGTRMREPVRDLVWFGAGGGRVGPSDGSYPILSMSSPTMAMYIPGAVRGVAVKGMDPKERKLVEKSVSATSGAPLTDAHETISVDAVSSGKQAPAETSYYPGAKNGSGGQFQPGNPVSKKVLAQAKATVELATAQMGIPMNIETIGAPDLNPGAVVRVRGISKNRFDGNYFIIKAEHVVSSDGYSTSLETVSNASKLTEGMDPTGAVNTKQPDPQAEGTVVASPVGA